MDQVCTVWSMRRVYGHQEHCTIDRPNLDDCPANRQLTTETEQQTKERRRRKGTALELRPGGAVRNHVTAPPVADRCAKCPETQVRQLPAGMMRGARAI